MIKLLELGSHYVSDFVDPDYDLGSRQKYSLDVYLDEAMGAARLNEVAPSHNLWGKYWYRSGTNSSMTAQLNLIVEEICSRFALEDDDLWLDIACNDGTLLKHVPNNIQKMGIDPADDTFLEQSRQVATVVQDYFSADAFYRSTMGHLKPKVITCIAMFYDLDNPSPFVEDLYQILDDNGLLVLQMSYTPLMLKQLAFDNICHEHVWYYDLTSIKRLFESGGFQVRDCSLNDTNGGSFRIYLTKAGADPARFGTGPLRDVCDFRVSSILAIESNQYNIRDPAIWEDFSERLTSLKNQTLEFLHGAKSSGKTVYGYGASTKGNTLLQVFGIDKGLIAAIAERSPYKYHKLTVCSDIPIVSEDVMRSACPDYLLILPWHFITEFAQREKPLMRQGTKLVVPCPRFEILSA